jgi:hypothetical protein
MASPQIPPPKKLSLHEGNVAENWRKFKLAWTNYELASGFAKKAEDVRVAALLTVIGEDAVETYQTFTWTTAGDEAKIVEVLKAFESYCNPRKNVMFDTYRFSCRKQEDGEPVDSYVTALRRLAENCEFQDKDRRLRDQVVLGLREEKVRERILREEDPDLKKVLEIVRANEIAVHQSQIMKEGYQEEANRVQRARFQKNNHGQRDEEPSQKKQGTAKATPNSADKPKRECYFCGQNHPFGKKEECPAWGKSCNKCAKPNHFAKCCKKSPDKTNSVETAEQVELFSIGSNGSKKTKTFTIQNTGKTLTFQIDTGASCNVISKKDYVRVTGDSTLQNVNPRKLELVTYGGRKWTCTGEAKLKIDDKEKTHIISVIVADIKAQPLLCLRTSEALGIVQILSCDQEEASAVNIHNGLGKAEILQKFPDVFSGLGKLRGQYRIYMDETIRPVVHPPRKFPVSIRDELKAKLSQMESDGVIAKVTDPTEWVSSLMVKKEPNKLRLCLDPRDLNRAIMREHYPLPCIEEVATRLADVKVFSAMDAKDGFWQIELEEKSSFLTTFNTPFGRYRWKRMPFGICSAPEVWQRKMHEFAEDLHGVEVIADDFLICGRGETEEDAVSDHDRNMLSLLQKARAENLKLNAKKMKVKLDEMPFIGHVLTNQGLKIDPRKIEAVTNMTIPKDANDIMRFLGMVQYCAKFLPKLSEITEPLRRLTDKDSEWQWTEVHNKAWEQVKSMMTNTPILAYYDSKKEVVIQCDASQSGIGAVLLQEGRPVHFSSRAMTATEQRYAQIEKEMLAIVHSCSRFEQYIYGRDVKVETDHKPLEMIFKKPISNSPKRLQRMLLFLQKFQLQVVYKKGAELYIADTLSRAYLKTTEGADLKEVLMVETERNVSDDLEKMKLVNSVSNSKRRIEEI